MIENPQSDFERIQNAFAVQIQAQPEFSNIQFADGTKWTVLTETQGDIEEKFAEMIALCGFSVVVQTPTARATDKFANIPGPRIDILTVPVQASEAVVFNRSDGGTNVHVQSAAQIISECLHLFTPPGLNGFNVPFKCREILPDRTRHPETGDLVSTMICSFEATWNAQSRTIK